MQIETDLTGKLLIALPGIGDVRFERSVILLCAHTPEFAMGIVLNKPVEGVDLQDLMEQMGIQMEISLRGVTVLEGGPVATERGFVLHTDDVICDGATLEVDGYICMTATRDILAWSPPWRLRASPCSRWDMPAGAQGSWKASWRRMPGSCANPIAISCLATPMSTNGAMP